MSLTQSLGTIFLIILIGITCRRIKVLNQTHIEGFEIILFKILTPCFLFSSIIEQDLETLLYLPYAYSYLLSFIFTAILTIIFFYKNNFTVVYVKILATGYVNSSIYALPVITFLLRDPRAAILSNMLQVIIIQSAFVTILGFLTHRKESLSTRLKTLIFFRPLIMIPILGLICNYMQIALNPLIIQVTKTLGSGASSIALFTFGLTLGGISLTKSDINKPLIALLLVKNIAHPLIAYLVGAYIFHLSSYWLTSLVIVTSAPTAFVVYLIAKHFTLEPELIKKMVALSSVMSLISLIIIIFCF